MFYVVVFSEVVFNVVVFNGVLCFIMDNNYILIIMIYIYHCALDDLLNIYILKILIK